MRGISMSRRIRAFTKLANSVNTNGKLDRGAIGGVLRVDGIGSSVSTINNLPLTGNSIGDMTFVESTDSLYVWKNGWYSVAIVNEPPTAISGNAASYDLAAGTPLVITLTSTDPDGFPLSWSYTGDPAGVATISQNENIFTITPSASTAGAFSLTFSATDGVNEETSISSFSLVLGPNWNALTYEGTKDKGGIQRLYFGSRLAGTDSHIIVGSPDRRNIGFGDYSGEVTTYKWGEIAYRTYGWVSQQVIPNNLGGYDQFGWSVAATGTGTDALFAASSPFEDTGGSNVGSVYIFNWNGSSWNQEARIGASDQQSNDNFGLGVDIDGNILVVGAPNEDAAGTNGGSTYLFNRVHNWQTNTYSWQESFKVVGRQSNNNWGSQVKVSESEQCFATSSSNAYGTGEVRIFRTHSFPRNYELAAIRPYTSTSDLLSFGCRFDMDGDTIAISGKYVPTNQWKVWVYTRTADKAWSLQQVLEGDDTAAMFGCAGHQSPIHLKGNHLWIGAWNENPNGKGFVYKFERSGSIWTRTDKFNLLSTTYDKGFGSSITTAENGPAGILAISAPGARVNNIDDAGKVHFWKTT